MAPVPLFSLYVSRDDYGEASELGLVLFWPLFHTGSFQVIWTDLVIGVTFTCHPQSVSSCIPRFSCLLCHPEEHHNSYDTRLVSLPVPIGLFPLFPPYLE